MPVRRGHRELNPGTFLLNCAIEDTGMSTCPCHPLPRLHIYRGKPFADGILRQLGDGVEVELLHDGPAVGLGGFDRNPEAHRDLLGSLAFGGELEDLALAGGEAAEGALAIDI